MEVVRRIRTFGQVDYGVLEGQQHPGVDFQGQVQVEGPIASLFRVKVDLPRLAQGVGLDEMPLVVDVETMVHGVVLELGNVPCDIDDCHYPQN